MIFNYYGTNGLPNYDNHYYKIIIIKDVDARYDHRIKMLQDEIDELESQHQLE